MILNGDLEKGEKFVLTNEAIVEIDKKTGDPKPRSKQWKRLFVLLGRKPIDGNGYIQEYNPKIRVEEIKKAFELCLSLFSMTFGFGSKNMCSSRIRSRRLLSTSESVRTVCRN